MARFMKKNKLLIALGAACVSLAVAAGAFSLTASATSETPESVMNLAGITLSQNTSYVSDSYFGVINVSVQDEDVVRASVDSQCRLVVTAISDGETSVSYWYRKTAADGWTSATMKVTVSGNSEKSSNISSSEAGIVFPKAEIGINVGESYTMDGVKVNGFSVKTSSLLWFSASDGVISVDSKTGKITAAGAGTAVLYAVDPSTNACSSITVKVVKG